MTSLNCSLLDKHEHIVVYDGHNCWDNNTEACQRNALVTHIVHKAIPNAGIAGIHQHRSSAALVITKVYNFAIVLLLHHNSADWRSCTSSDRCAYASSSLYIRLNMSRSGHVTGLALWQRRSCVSNRTALPDQSWWNRRLPQRHARGFVADGPQCSVSGGRHICAMSESSNQLPVMLQGFVM
jgi:hypothetical protein